MGCFVGCKPMHLFGDFMGFEFLVPKCHTRRDLVPKKNTKSRVWQCNQIQKEYIIEMKDHRAISQSMVVIERGKYQ